MKTAIKKARQEQPEIDVRATAVVVDDAAFREALRAALLKLLGKE